MHFVIDQSVQLNILLFAFDRILLTVFKKQQFYNGALRFRERSMITVLHLFDVVLLVTPSEYHAESAKLKSQKKFIALK